MFSFICITGQILELRCIYFPFHLIDRMVSSSLHRKDAFSLLLQNRLVCPYCFRFADGELLISFEELVSEISSYCLFSSDPSSVFL